MDDRRRQFLQQALAAGWLTGGSGWAGSALAAASPEAAASPAGRPVFQFSGEVWVNQQRATEDTKIAPGDVVETGANASAIAVIGRDAFLLRSQTRVDFALGRALRRGLRLVSGGLLGVFGRRDELLEISTPAATIGIRGTGVYAEAHKDQDYVCTCYGSVEIAASRVAGTAPERITSRHHDAARWVMAQGEPHRCLMPAPMQNHNDMELVMLEALVGREVPFDRDGRIMQTPRMAPAIR